MGDTVLSTASRAVLDACERLGLDVDALLSEAGLERAQVYDPDRRLPAARADALWQAAYARAHDPSLALHAAEALPFGAYKVVDFLAAHSATIGEGLRRIAAFFPLVDSRVVFEIEVAERASITMRTAATNAIVPAPAQQYTFAALVTRARVCAGASWSPEAVELSFATPVDVREHQRIFACPVRFDAPAPRLLCSLKAWHAPVSGADAALLTVLEDHASRLVAELPPREDLCGRVRSALAEELAGGEPSARQVARRLAMSERTLSRRLHEEGASLAQLLDETRAALAKTHLRNPRLGLSEIAWLVGFADQSAFTRAFRRWTGETPGAWRSQRA